MNANKREENKAVACMLVCAVLWSTAGIFIKQIPWNPLVIAGFRSLIASGAVAVYMRATGLKLVLNRASGLAAIFLALTFMAFVTANKLTTAANAIVLQFTAPVFIMVISSLLFGQKFRPADYMVVGATVLGMALFFFDKLTPGNLLGNCVGILAGFFMAGMYIFTGRANESERMSGILLGQLLTAAIGVPLAFVLPTPISKAAVVSIIILGVFQVGIPYVLFGIAVKRCPPLMCSLLGAAEPLLNPVWVLIFDGERPGAFALVGGLIIVAAVTAWCVWRDKSATDKAAAA